MHLAARLPSSQLMDLGQSGLGQRPENMLLLPKRPRITQSVLSCSWVTMGNVQLYKGPVWPGSALWVWAGCINTSNVLGVSSLSLRIRYNTFQFTSWNYDTSSGKHTTELYFSKHCCKIIPCDFTQGGRAQSSKKPPTTKGLFTQHVMLQTS